ncbi:permease prefix domain 1-containing protein [Intestinibacter sp.]
MLTKYDLKIKEYVEELFQNAPQNKKTIEFKEELLSNLLEKYNDLVESGMEREVAYNKVIGSIGNVEDLFEEGNIIVETKESFSRKKHARNIAIAVMMYILSPVCVIITDNWGNENLGVIFMFILIAAATGLIIYTSMSNVKYKKQEDTIVEEFKEWKSTKSNNYRAYRATKSAISAITVVVYLVVSFITFEWWITWIIFIIGVAIEKVAKAYFEIKEM